MANQHPEIDDLLREERRFAPSAAFIAAVSGAKGRMTGVPLTGGKPLISPIGFIPVGRVTTRLPGEATWVRARPAGPTPAIAPVPGRYRSDVPVCVVMNRQPSLRR